MIIIIVIIIIIIDIAFSLLSFLVTPFSFSDTRIYPHTASKYHAWPKARRGIAIRFPYSDAFAALRPI